jgi:hypothetical protein
MRKYLGVRYKVLASYTIKGGHYFMFLLILTHDQLQGALKLLEYGNCGKSHKVLKGCILAL